MSQFQGFARTGFNYYVESLKTKISAFIPDAVHDLLLRIPKTSGRNL